MIIALNGCALFRPVVVTKNRVPSNWSDKVNIPDPLGDYSNIPKTCNSYVKDYLGALRGISIANIELEKIDGMSEI